MQTIVVGRIEVQGPRVVIGDGHTRLAHVGVGPVDVHLAVAGEVDQHILDSRLAHTGLALQMHRVVPAVEEEVHRFLEVDGTAVKFNF